MTDAFKVTLTKEIIFAHHQGPGWAQESSGDYSYKFEHRVTLPFAPYVGLSVAYDHKEAAFDQGDKAKNESIRHFSSGPITAVEWNAGANAFTCSVAPVRLGDKDDLGHLLWQVQREHWFAAESTQALEIQEMITRWRMAQAGQENAGNVCYSKDEDLT